MVVVEIYHRSCPMPLEKEEFAVRELAEQYLLKKGFSPVGPEATHWDYLHEPRIGHYATITPVASPA